MVRQCQCHAAKINCYAHAGATRVFVMLPGKPGSAPPPGFRRKPGFQLRLRRALHVRYSSCCTCALDREKKREEACAGCIAQLASPC